MEQHNPDAVREAVRDSYGKVATGQQSGCCSSSSSACCGSSDIATVDSRRIGYSDDELAAAPAGANLGLGCGNPQAIAALTPGEVVLDLGSGAGFDCFLAARQVGLSGRVIGVDMTPDMLAKARENARTGGYINVEFRLGEIEALPVADNSVDVIISNCVINLSPEKDRVFREAFRVLKPGGRLAISDVVATAEIPDDVRADLGMLSSCISGASMVTKIELMLREAGFAQLTIDVNEASRAFIKDWAPGRGIEAYVASATIEAVKP